ncbi:TetR/AcrR family transcriptional regulator [Paenibacillus radicis (ex Xue et al. 2023)]|uniref:TetR/AcrR family transcriptional regulator n=1 Tax=Paenibacillus radicis (ex Xue et al. 2023) TaxID=2972489 RepID=A0ABT1YLH5_9BACL|nr:TetR/AcrR family transcriptional regulator [Paenibacillus radicis (ex Xue et al. 2023)]MCR8634045.1 TetR/AcrR family transcriptional regulator [Paenibacillus radicis (ex Xue et al. 2023)]
MMTDSKDHLRDERREQIKRAALKVFAQRGLIGTKMNMIAREAQISDGLSYRYFKSKEEILTELIKEAIEGSNEAFALITNMPGSPIEKVRTLTNEILQEDNHHFILMQQVMLADELPNEVVELLKTHDSAAMINTLTAIIAKGQHSGEFVEGNPKELAMWYLTSLVGLMNIQKIDIEGYQLPDADFMMRLIVKPNPI